MNDLRAPHGAPDLAPVFEQIRSKFSASCAPLVQQLVKMCCASLASDELAERSASAWGELFADLFIFMKTREPGRTLVRAFNPAPGTKGGEGACSVVQIVTEDMPFLVDTVGMAVAGARLQAHRLIHPVLCVKRDARGELTAIDDDCDDDRRESLMHVEVDRVSDDELHGLQHSIEAAFNDVRSAVEDWRAMRDKMLEVADVLPNRRMPFNAEEVAEAQAFLRWAVDDHFTFLGYREYAVVASGGDELLEAKPASGLGILRRMDLAVAPRSLKSLAASRLPVSGSMDAIILTKTNARARVHRPGYMDYIGVLCFDDKGKPVGEQRFLGLFTSTAYMRRPQDVPLVRQKVEAVMQRSGLRRDSHSGKAMRHILETLPRDELLQSSADELSALSGGIFELKDRARPKLFVRRDAYGRFFSCLVFIPRDHLARGMREKVESMLKDALHGERVDSTIEIGESPLARLHAVVRPRAGEHPEYDLASMEEKLAQIVRNWHDDLRDALVERVGNERGARLLARYGRSLSAGYIEEVTPQRAAQDVETLAELSGENDIRLRLYRSHNRDELHFKIFRSGPDIALSEVLPLLENAGLKVLTEQVYTLDVKDAELCIQDVTVQAARPLSFDIDELHENFESAFEAIWRGRAENDGFNKLLLHAKLSWRQVAVLRAYCKYQQQVGTTFSQTYMEETLNDYPLIAGLLIELFEARFDPARGDEGKTGQEAARKRLQGELEALLPEAVRKREPEFAEQVSALRTLPREQQVEGLIVTIKTLLENVSSLDEDRILRGFMAQIRATLRTNYFQTHDGKPAEYLSFKFDSHQVPDIPKPVPYREIWVYAPRVEGVHLRFGPVARGGLRWSDRREDFRTEVLGLVKAQMVKNTVIVPVGSKGGFFVKKSPASGGDAAANRDAIQAEGIACYKIFINGLLDITDNIVDGKVTHPENVVRHDGDDPYLVVAADKGTATFSDIANGIAIEHGFWLGDAFASGGSAGYDHKAMGITAKGAWESVKRHFRALSRDCQSQDFTCVGIGDMSGDVFGNGMLLSKHTRLLAAFDHRHIFLDPNPDAASSFAERERMFQLPRSSWDDYDKSKISAGGGVYARSLKSIPVSKEVRTVLGISGDAEQMAPNELMRAILKAPVDLLFNGGIGTYVKAATETNADAGDRANNALRIDGHELRCKIVGEGGNLGFTQKGRIEAAQHGVLLNTDFIDNSAGVDTSDHEVNIKILLNDAVTRGELDMQQRNALLASMTDEVEKLVLWDNYRQNVALSLMEHMSVNRLGSKAHFIRTLEAHGQLDRQIESLPSDAELAERKARHLGLTRPELCILLSYAKIVLYQQLLDSDVPENPWLSHELERYFPEPLREKYSANMQRHRLKREIIATAVTNSMVNRMGATFMLRMQEDTGQTPAAVAKAYNAAREILGAREFWARIEALDGQVAEGTQVDALLKLWALLRHMTRWLLNKPGTVLDIAGLVERYHPGMEALRAALPAALTPTGRASFDVDMEKWQGLGFPDQLAEDLAEVPVLSVALDIVETARDSGQPIEKVARVFFELGEALDIEWLRNQIEALPVESGWHAQARGSLRDELASQQRALANQVLASKTRDGGSPVAAWLDRDDPALKFTRSMLDEIRTQNVDYPIASVALRRLAQLAQMQGAV